jgi:hypothetical protein
MPVVMKCRVVTPFRSSTLTKLQPPSETQTKDAVSKTLCRLEARPKWHHFWWYRLNDEPAVDWDTHDDPDIDGDRDQNIERTDHDPNTTAGQYFAQATPSITPEFLRTLFNVSFPFLLTTTRLFLIATCPFPLLADYFCFARPDVASHGPTFNFLWPINNSFARAYFLFCTGLPLPFLGFHAPSFYFHGPSSTFAFMGLTFCLLRPSFDFHGPTLASHGPIFALHLSCLPRAYFYPFGGLIDLLGPSLFSRVHGPTSDFHRPDFASRGPTLTSHGHAFCFPRDYTLSGLLCIFESHGPIFRFPRAYFCIQLPTPPIPNSLGTERWRFTNIE